MTYRYKYITESVFSTPVTLHGFKLRATPCCNAFQTVLKSSLQITASLNGNDVALGKTFSTADGLGNMMQWGMVAAPHDRFCFVSEGTVKLTGRYYLPIKPEPHYAAETPLTAATDDMRAFASRFSNPLALMLAVHDIIAYTPCLTTTSTTAADVWNDRRGVCQDFAHLLIALCRANGWHARYVNGFITGEGATHAWVEVSDGKQWTAFDPTLGSVAECDYVKIAHGRDANDCPTNRGHFVGFTTETMTVSVSLSNI